MPIPDPATFIGNRCVIRFKNRPMVFRTIVAIDTRGVKIEEETGGTTIIPFSEIAEVSLKQPKGQTKK